MVLNMEMLNCTLRPFSTKKTIYETNVLQYATSCFSFFHKLIQQPVLLRLHYTGFIYSYAVLFGIVGFISFKKLQRNFHK